MNMPAGEFIINPTELPNGYALISNTPTDIQYRIPSEASIANIIPEIKITNDRYIFNHWQTSDASYSQETLKNQVFTTSLAITAMFVRYSGGGGSSGRP